MTTINWLIVGILLYVGVSVFIYLNIKSKIKALTTRIDNLNNKSKDITIEKFPDGSITWKDSEGNVINSKLRTEI